MAITDALEEITAAGNYTFDLSPFTDEDGQTVHRVNRGRVFFGDSDPLPMVAILERPEESEELTDPNPLPTASLFNYHLVIQGFLNDNKDNPTDDAHILLADVRRRLAIERARKDQNQRLPDPFGLGSKREYNRIDDFDFGAGLVRPPDEVSAKSYFWLPVKMKLIEDPLYPFN
ncbi:hypothetical protein [Alterisphingorhabdus coralli]|uniref:Uncharacterized protein n=1 Tax=Alterisphingorhabdus coralli TaxID=3071408 RepID=A0AA97I2E8_9SPHN|nr:hypothetical protein [Parasphingorhabdus sp. SCSIO 66989]WOE76320.1 hypothetical protein RB602_06305 [Parasphingorhabdus sp. SCSIO 66989]